MPLRFGRVQLASTVTPRLWQNDTALKAYSTNFLCTTFLSSWGHEGRTSALRIAHVGWHLWARTGQALAYVRRCPTMLWASSSQLGRAIALEGNTHLGRICAFAARCASKRWGECGARLARGWSVGFDRLECLTRSRARTQGRSMMLLGIVPETPPSGSPSRAPGRPHIIAMGWVAMRVCVCWWRQRTDHTSHADELH